MWGTNALGKLVRKRSITRALACLVIFGSGALHASVAATNRSSTSTKITGVYQCDVGNTIKNSLYVLELPNHKMKFDMNSLWIGNPATGQVHTGGAQGVIDVANNVAVY